MLIRDIIWDFLSMFSILISVFTFIFGFFTGKKYEQHKINYNSTSKKKASILGGKNNSINQ